MKVAIIAPPYPLREGPAPPLGVCYVAAALEAAGADVRIFDFVVSGYTPEKLRSWMEAFQPDAVGSTSVTLNFYDAAAIVCEAKRIDPRVVTMMGGPHVTFTAAETLAAYPEIDLIVLGEGERTVAELLPVLREPSAWKDVAGVMFREDGQIRQTAARDLIQDLNTLPLPARHLLPLSRYKAMGFPISITTSRGCPHLCIFCQGRRIVGSRMRFRDISLVVDEIEHLMGLGFDRINIADDLFTAKKERVLALCEEVRRRSLRFGWGAFSRVNTLDMEMAEAMRDAGCDCISFGMETGNQEMLDRVRKAATLDQARRAADICKQAGVAVHATFIAGLPGETPETLAQTRAFAESLGVAYGYHLLAPFPGTTVRDQVQDFDLEILTDDWSLHDANHAITRTSGLSPAQAEEFVAQYDAQIAQAWKDMEKRKAEGSLSPMEGLRLEGEHRMELIFAILSQDLVEAANAPGGKGQGSLDHLAGTIAAAANRPRPLVDATLAWFLGKGLIQRTTQSGQEMWQWAPNLPAVHARLAS